MTTVDPRPPRFYARLAGAIYLIAMALAMFTQVYVPSQILVRGDVAATASNIMANEGLFRAGIIIDVLVFVSDVLLAWAFYQLLRPVDEGLAILGAFMRIADAAILASMSLNSLFSVMLLSGADYLQGIPAEELQGLARLFMGMNGYGLYIGFVFLGIGSTVFAYLLYKSRMVPRVLAGWGIFASPLLTLASLASLYNSWFAANLSLVAMGPMFLYEVPLGLWFLIKGVKAPAPPLT